MAETAKKKAHVLSSFEDSGTGESFEAGKSAMIEAGAFANYEAAGLVRAHGAAATAQDSAQTGAE